MFYLPGTMPEPKLELKKVGVLLRDASQVYPLEETREIFARQGIEAVLLNETGPTKGLDLIVAMGGDGTVLRALDMMPHCPVLAINYGNVGFLTAGNRDDLPLLLDKLLAGQYVISDRIMLSCKYNGSHTHAVNEVVVRASRGMAYFNVWVDGIKIRTIRGDGVIVGTPTGATGYLLSTGGPLVMPGSDVFVLDGINEYNFTSRALVLPANSQISLELPQLHSGQVATLVVDGKEVLELSSGSHIAMNRSERMARLIFFEESYFFDNLSHRLSWK